MTTRTFIETETYTSIRCCDCGMIFFVPELWDKEHRFTGNGFYCPNGHPLTYDGDQKKMQREMARKQAALDQERADNERLRGENNALDRRRQAQRSATTRLKNRIARGKCPCCGNDFADVAKHMAEKHPGYGESEE